MSSPAVSVKPTVLPDPRDEARTLIARWLLVISATAFAIGALLIGSSAMPMPGRAWMAGGFAALSGVAVAALGGRLGRPDTAVVVVNVGAQALIAATGMLNGWGLSAPSSGFLAVMPLVMAAIVSARVGLVTALASIVLLLGLAWAEHMHWIRGVEALAEASLARRLANQVLLVVVALAAGLLTARVVDHYMRGSNEREARFVGLLGIAVDTYWEIDADFTETRVWLRGPGNRFVRYDRPMRAPWDQPEWIYEDGGREAHLADIAAHRPFRDLRARYRRPDGTFRHELISGEPRIDAAGRFLGYWGVTRDVTADVRMREEVEASQARYHQLFDLSPVALVIHRGWRVLDANPAALLMFGYPDLASMRGTDLLEPLAPDDRTRALARVSRLIAGERLEPTTYSVTRLDGTCMTQRVTGTCIEAGDPPTVLSIFDDISELVEAQQAVAKARDDAQSANLAKSAFLASMSHEIRTPLNGLVGLARLARAPELGDVHRRQYVEQIAASAEMLAAVISDVLDLSKIEAGKLELEQLAFDLPELLDGLRQVYGMLADAQGLGFALELDPGVPRWVTGDPVRLRQVLSNYLSNAIKFTTQGSITLEARRGGGDLVTLEVRDTGPGFPPEVGRRLFQPFTQADASVTRRYGGSGLGLSICRELAALMHGFVGADSEPGKGSRFWIELPLPGSAAVHEPADAAIDPAALRGARVLVVEDNPVNMMIAVAMLQQWGVAAEQATDGARAIAAFAQAAHEGRPFDVVLMDVHMPQMSGYDTTRALRATDAGRHVPIIALTAAALSSEREEAIASGMNGFLTKPIDARKLCGALLAALDRAP